MNMLYRSKVKQIIESATNVVIAPLSITKPEDIFNVIL